MSRWPALEYFRAVEQLETLKEFSVDSPGQVRIEWSIGTGLLGYKPLATAMSNLFTVECWKELREEAIARAQVEVDHRKKELLVSLGSAVVPSTWDLKNACQDVWKSDYTLVCTRPRGHTGEHAMVGTGHTWTGGKSNADRVAELFRACRARIREEWSEEDASVLWWHWPVEEPPYVGHPNSGDWPEGDNGSLPVGYYTHWTPLIVPSSAQGVVP